MNATAPQVADPVPMISICMFCKRQIVAGHMPTGPELAPAANHSHGICRDCAPGYFHKMGLSEAQQHQILGSLHD